MRGCRRERAKSRGVDSLVIRGLAGGFLSLAVTFAAYRRMALTRSGAWAAAVTGVVLVLAGWRWLALVGVFFISSSVLTRLEASGGTARRSFDRGGRRWQQVAANGGVAAICAAGTALTGWPQGFAVAAGAVAAATADTWATEIGRWSRTPPRLIATGRPVEPGVSGGVTAAGTLAAVAGALFIGAVAFVLESASSGPGGAAPHAASAAWIAAGGFTGSLLDSVLGATLEGRVPGLNNDTVNLAATACGAALVFYATRPY